MISSREDMSFSKDFKSMEDVLDFMTSGPLVVLSRTIFNNSGGSSLCWRKICSKSTVLVSLLMLFFNILDMLRSLLMSSSGMSRRDKVTELIKSSQKFWKTNSKKENSLKKKNTKSRKPSSILMPTPKKNFTKSS